MYSRQSKRDDALDSTESDEMDVVDRELEDSVSTILLYGINPLKNRL